MVQCSPAVARPLLAIPLLLVAASSSEGPTTPRSNLSVVWDSPTVEPGVAHRNTNGPVISGGMPLGNGELAVLAFPLVPVVGSILADLRDGGDDLEPHAAERRARRAVDV